MQAVVPGLSRMAVTYQPSKAGSVATLRAGEKYARELGFQIIPVQIETVGEIMPALERALGARPQAMGSIHGPSFFGTGLGYFAPVLDLAHRERLPQLYGDAMFVRAGGLMSIGDNLLERWRLIADLIEKILRDGAIPGDLPVARPSLYEIVVNLSSARKLGVTIPDAVLRQATEVIP
jgi:putative ABC transport system substrate-binding protein